MLYCLVTHLPVCSSLTNYTTLSWYSVLPKAVTVIVVDTTVVVPFIFVIYHDVISKWPRDNTRYSVFMRTWLLFLAANKLTHILWWRMLSEACMCAAPSVTFVFPFSCLRISSLLALQAFCPAYRMPVSRWFPLKGFWKCSGLLLSSSDILHLEKCKME